MAASVGRGSASQTRPGEADAVISRVLIGRDAESKDEKQTFRQGRASSATVKSKQLSEEPLTLMAPSPRAGAEALFPHAE
jgi:hypothetical protein